MGFGGAGVAFCEQLPVDVFQVGDAAGELGAAGAVDLGAELEPQPLAELVVVGAQLPYLVAGQGEVGAQAGWGGRCLRGLRAGVSGGGQRLALAGLVEVLT